jgi:hypothetical protein
VNPGDLLILFFANDGTPSVSHPTGWTFLFGWDNVAAKLSCYIKRADGAEDGTTVNLVTTTAEKGAAQVYRITRWRDSGTIANDVEYANAVGVGTSPDPPSFDPTNWGAENTLWIAAYGADDDDDASAFPPSYTGAAYTESDNSADSASMATARRQLRAASDDPGAFTIGASQEWVSSTMAVRPAAG